MDEPKTDDNTLLACLDPNSLNVLQGLFQRIDLPIGYKCAVANQAIEDIYFPTRGIIVRNVCEPGMACVDAGLYGCDGFAGIPLVFGIDRSPHDDIVQVAGEALRAPAGDVIDLMRRDTFFRSVLLRFAYCLSLQASCSALSNRTSEMISRLSRLLIMCHDRIAGHGLHLTHSFLATTLGVRRASVTSAMHLLEGNRLIKATRGQVQIRDRRSLEQIAGQSYGVPEREYARIMEPRCGRGRHER